MTWDGIIPKKRRRQFAQFLSHPDKRIREMGEKMQREDATTRRHLRGEYEPWETGEPTGDVNLDFDIAAAYPDHNDTEYDWSPNNDGASIEQAIADRARGLVEADLSVSIASAGVRQAPAELRTALNQIVIALERREYT